ncbi:MAG: beta-ketoacyl-[acyl-carrier-protein] synthase family protein [Bacteroidota bacterium]
MKNRRVVVTGMGVVAPNGIGLAAFEEALRRGRSGIQHFEELERLKFGCQIGGLPDLSEEKKREYFTELELNRLKASGIIYGVMAGMDAWQHAGLSMPEKDAEADWESGCVFGAGLAGAEVMRDAAYMVDEGKVKRMGSTTVPQVMSSGVSAYLGGKLGLGNQVTTNASACSTGSESLLMGYERIMAGRAERMICGGCDSSGPYVWGGFDAMRVTNRRFNDEPTRASRPMSATARGFVPGGGGGALLLESYESAQQRGAAIYAEFLGGYVNSGGQQNGGTMTAPNPAGIVRCIRGALRAAGITAHQLDAISGHLTSTMFDPIEIRQWTEALGRAGGDFPYINSLKSMIGHCLSAAGAIESVAVVLQLHQGFLHPSINCEDLHPDIAARIDPTRIPRTEMSLPLNIMAKSSFGFGDVNSCVIFSKNIQD